MNQRPSDPLDRALGALRPHGASENFTARVLAELDRPRRPTRRAVGFWAAAAAALLALAVGLTVGLQPNRSSQEELAAASRELRTSHRELVRELEALRLETVEKTPVVYLGSGGDLDLIIDLERFIAETGPEYRPVSLEKTPQNRL